MGRLGSLLIGTLLLLAAACGDSHRTRTDAGGGVDAGTDAGDTMCPPCVPPPSDDCIGSGPCGCGPYECPDAGTMTMTDANIHDGGSSSLDGDIMCPPCVPPPSEDCVGTGPCGCGPYECPDAGAMCGGGRPGWCSGDLACNCCPAGGPTQLCLCSETCTSDTQCTDPARPVCNRSPTGPGFCSAAGFGCCWLCL